MEQNRHILRLLTCTAVFFGQVLCSGGISYCRPSASGDNRSDGSDSISIAAKIAPTTSHNPLALKINFLYTLFLIPEVSVEYGFGDGWSVSGGWMYGWWKHEVSHHYWRAYGGYASLRRYLGPQKKDRPLTGHHVGVYGQLLTYDVEFGGKGYMAGRPGGSLWDKPSYGFGVEYGFSLPASSSVNFDFSLGVGYLGGTYYEYTPMNGHYVWDATKSRHWFGPTKAEISVVWFINKSFHGQRKGGRR